MQEEKEMTKLRELYDELWHNAKTMVRDMTDSITMYLISGILVLVFALLPIAVVANSVQVILAGGTHWLLYFFVLFGAAGTLLYVGMGIKWLRWYSKLRSRYANLLKIEKTIEE